MKRDMNLIRLLLLETEGEDPKPDLSAYTEEQSVYHSACAHRSRIGSRCHLDMPAVNLWNGQATVDVGRPRIPRCRPNDTIWQRPANASKSRAWMSRLRCCKEILNQLLKQSLDLS